MNLDRPRARRHRPRPRHLPRKDLTLTTERFDAYLEVRPAASKGIKNHQRVRVHLGAAERLGKIAFSAAATKLEPKSRATARSRLTEPLLALRGDHFIVRDETAQRTLGRRHRRPSLGQTAQARRRRTAQNALADAAQRRSRRLDGELSSTSGEAFALPIGSHLSVSSICARKTVRGAIDRMKDSARLQRRRRKSLHDREQVAAHERAIARDAQRISCAPIRWFPAWTWKSCAASSLTICRRNFFAWSSILLIAGKTHRQGREPGALGQPSGPTRRPGKNLDGQNKKNSRRAAAGAARFEGD